MDVFPATNRAVTRERGSSSIASERRFHVVSVSRLHEEVLMADLREEQKCSYRRYNTTLAVFPFSISFGVTNLLPGPWAGRLNQFTFSGFTSGYYVAARGSLASRCTLTSETS